MFTETLTSRERVLRTLNRQPVDRAPIDLGSHMSTGISAFAYTCLRQALDLPQIDVWVPDLVQCLAGVDEDVLRRFHVDCALLEPCWPNPFRWQPRENFCFVIPQQAKPKPDVQGGWTISQNHRAMIMPPDGYFFYGDWLANWSDADENDMLEMYEKEARRIYNETDYAVNFAGYSFGVPFNAFFGGIDHVLEMLDEPYRVIEAHDFILEEYLHRLGKIIDRFGQYIQLISIGADMGNQDRPMCKPAIIETFTTPYLYRFCEFIHQNSDIKVFLYSNGSIQPLLPALIEAGVDVLNPVQITARNMDPHVLKKVYGDQIIFWGGGCDTQVVLPHSTPGAVALHVRELVETLGVGGGYVFCPVHNIPGDAPAENIIAAYDAAYEASFISGSGLT